MVKLLCPNKSAMSSSGAPFVRGRVAKRMPQVLRPRHVQHPTFRVYHVPRQTVLTALTHTAVDCQNLASMTSRSLVSSSTVRSRTRLLSSRGCEGTRDIIVK